MQFMAPPLINFQLPLIKEIELDVSILTRGCSKKFKMNSIFMGTILIFKVKGALLEAVHDRM
jgi:hypothetical protein